MSVDQYLLNDMRKILINNIKIHMNVRCGEMTNSEIANLTMLVEVRNVKTFYQKNMFITEFSNSTNINNMKNYLSPQIIEHVEKLFVILSETFFFLFQVYKIFIRTECVGSEIIAMQVVNIC